MGFCHGYVISMVLVRCACISTNNVNLCLQAPWKERRWASFENVAQCSKCTTRNLPRWALLLCCLIQSAMFILCDLSPQLFAWWVSRALYYWWPRWLMSPAVETPWQLWSETVRPARFASLGWTYFYRRFLCLSVSLRSCRWNETWALLVFDYPGQFLTFCYKLLFLFYSCQK